MRLSRAFWGLVLLGLVVRLLMAALAPQPGIADPTHYYNLARNLAEGRGFVIDYIWQYHNPPAEVTHPIDYWMPLPAIWPALGLTLAPGSLFAALVPSALFGAWLPALAYGIAASLRESETTRLLAMLGVLFLPELVLNSARTDTTISYILFIGLTGVWFYLGLRRRPALLLLAGMSAGLAQLSRQDGVLMAPAMLVTLALYALTGTRLPWRWLWLIPAGWLLTLAPWLWRNWELYGVLLPSGASRTLFMTSFTDQFTYGRTLDLDHYLAWGWDNILVNWATQALANGRTMVQVLDNALPVFALGGVSLMLWRREREPLLMLALPLVMLLGLFVFYSFLTPFHTQGGSFKKSYLLITPFMAFAGAWGLARLVRPRGMAFVLAGGMAAVMLLNALDLVRADFALGRAYDASVALLSETLDAAGDVNGDGAITVMTQDPFMLNYHGYPALMIPSDPRDMILEAAYRYEVDYIMLPAARPALDPLYDNAASDPRLTWLPVRGDDHFQLLRVEPPS